ILTLAQVPDSIIHFSGNKNYQLTNHLGDVIAVVTDKEIPVTSDQVAVSGLRAQVIQANNYYPYGMIMPNALNLVPAKTYKFGYNGMERDDEVKGNGNSYTTDF